MEARQVVGARGCLYFGAKCQAQLLSSVDRTGVGWTVNMCFKSRTYEISFGSVKTNAQVLGIINFWWVGMSRIMLEPPSQYCGSGMVLIHTDRVDNRLCETGRSSLKTVWNITTATVIWIHTFSLYRSQLETWPWQWSASSWRNDSRMTGTWIGVCQRVVYRYLKFKLTVLAIVKVSIYTLIAQSIQVCYKQVDILTPRIWCHVQNDCSPR